jgi:hypothetical protein
MYCFLKNIIIGSIKSNRLFWFGLFTKNSKNRTDEHFIDMIQMVKGSIPMKKIRLAEKNSQCVLYIFSIWRRLVIASGDKNLILIYYLHYWSQLIVPPMFFTKNNSHLTFINIYTSPNLLYDIKKLSNIYHILKLFRSCMFLKNKTFILSIIHLFFYLFDKIYTIKISSIWFRWLRVLFLWKKFG